MVPSNARFATACLSMAKFNARLTAGSSNGATLLFIVIEIMQPFGSCLNGSSCHDMTLGLRTCVSSNSPGWKVNCKSTSFAANLNAIDCSSPDGANTMRWTSGNGAKPAFAAHQLSSRSNINASGAAFTSLNAPVPTGQPWAMSTFSNVSASLPSQMCFGSTGSCSSEFSWNRMKNIRRSGRVRLSCTV